MKMVESSNPSIEIDLNEFKLHLHLDVKADMLTWPFGICSLELIHKAFKAGCVAAFTMSGVTQPSPNPPPISRHEFGQSIVRKNQDKRL